MICFVPFVANKLNLRYSIIGAFQRVGSLMCWTWQEVQFGRSFDTWQAAHVVRGVVLSSGSNEAWQLEHDKRPSVFPFNPGASFTR